MAGVQFYAALALALLPSCAALLRGSATILSWAGGGRVTKAPFPDNRPV